MKRPLIVFSHANSFPGSTYRLVTDKLSQLGHHVHVVDRFGHNARYPVTHNWPHLTQELADFVAHAMHQENRDAWLVGHSLGGILSRFCAGKFPRMGQHRIRGVVVLDSPLMSGFRRTALSLAKRTGMIDKTPLVVGAKRRRTHWPDLESVHQGFAKKPLFQRWHPDVLNDYVRMGTREVATHQGEVRYELHFDRDVEMAIYQTLPDNLPAFVRKHPLQCPLAYIAGSESEEMKYAQQGFAGKLIAAQPGLAWQVVEGGHLFPMEKPIETAQAIDRALRAM